MKEYTLRQKVGQLMICGFEGKTSSKNIKELIEKYHVGGILFFTRNIGSAEETLSLTNDLQRTANDAGHEYPLLISIDQENGTVRRLGEGTTFFPGNMALGAIDCEHVTHDVAYGTASELHSLGINMNLAPVLDVNNNPKNPVIGVRSFGEDPVNVGKLGVASVQGHQKAGVITTLKHFPGHGDTHVDSHLALPMIAHGRDRLDEVELLPFRQAIESGADCVMVAHVYFPAIEKQSNVPATLSEAVIRGLLRKEMGFNGAVTTDCLEMNAIKDTVGTPEGALLALKAGNDLLMVSHTYKLQVEAIERIVKAVHDGEISEALIDEALERVLALKKKYLSWDTQRFPERVSKSVNGVEHNNVAIEAYQRSVTLLRNDGILPFEPKEEELVFVVYPSGHSYNPAEDKNSSRLLGEAVKEHHPNTTEIVLETAISDELLDRVVKQAQKSDYVLVGTSNANMSDEQKILVNRLLDLKIPLAVIGMRSPYDLLAYPEVPAYLVTYEYTPKAIETAVDIIFGKREALGRLPVTLPGLYERGFGITK